MVILCPKCETKYQVEEGEIPSGGAGVSCPKCKNVFTIYKEISPIELVPYQPKEKEDVVAPPPPPVEEKIPPEREEEVEPTPPTPTLETPPEVKVSQEAEGLLAPEIETVEPPVPPPSPTPLSEVEVMKEAEVVGEDERFQEARKLARSLVKDIVLYHGERVEEGLKKGILIQLVGDEIRKSWGFYKEQVPSEVLKSSEYFKDALNEILAKGKRIFT